jgi:hypothetical protein
MKNTIPLCLQKNDSDKNNNIIVIAKAICRKSFFWIPLKRFKNNITIRTNNPKTPISESD